MTSWSTIPSEDTPRDSEVVNGQYNDEDEGFAPLLDEGFFDDDDTYE